MKTIDDVARELLAFLEPRVEITPTLGSLSAMRAGEPLAAVLDFVEWAADEQFALPMSLRKDVEDLIEADLVVDEDDIQILREDLARMPRPKAA